MILELFDGLEGSAFERLPGEDREPDFDLVQPGGVGWRVAEMHVLVPRQPHVALGFMRREIVEDDMDFLVWVIRGHFVHEVEKLDSAAALIMPACDLAIVHIESRKQGRGAMPFVIMRLTGEGAPIWQLEIALRALQSLDGGFFIESKDNRILW